MIPDSIRREHVNAAMDEIDRCGIPPSRNSRKFFVSRQEKRYPPKVVISIALKIAIGKELPTGSFNGGAETNNVLRKLGFPIGQYQNVNADTGEVVNSKEIPIRRPISKSANHNERCPECKLNIEALLIKLYGSAIRNAKFKVPATPLELPSSDISVALTVIYEALQQHRGHSSFVRCETLPHCDFFIPNPGFILEFDESQHFTPLRKLALGLYPADLAFGFDLPEWLRLCDRFQKHDDDPPFRDEQRAWYDTLRDFTPYLENLRPTIRLHAGGFEWCSLSPEKVNDLETFRQIVSECANFWKLHFQVPEKPVLARLAIDGSWRGDSANARKLLRDISDAWPVGAHVRCISTPGAFLKFDWPSSMPREQDNRFPSERAVERLNESARALIDRLLGDGLREHLARHSDYLSIGIDTTKQKISSTDNYIQQNHAELVYVINLQSGKVHFTGKSYLTPNQERGLLRVSDLRSHFVEMGTECAMVLGCHDLTIFNPRSDARASGWRSEVKDAFKRLAKQKAPTFVLHHPHTTVKRLTWQHAWNALRRDLPSVHSWTGTGCYSFRDSKNGLRKRDPLQSVLDATKSADTLDVIVSMGNL